MNIKLFLIATTAAIVFCSTVYAGPASQQMSDCLVKQTTGQDRLDMAQWILVAFAKHPDAGTVVSLAPGVDDEANKKMAELVETLVVDRCFEESKRAFIEDGPAAFEIAFSAVGQMAAMELMQNRDVNTYVQEFAKQIDQAKIKKLTE